MSTISSHLNWGASYISLDFYKRFVNKGASEKQIVFVGRISTIILMFLAGFLALNLSDALGAFQILLQIGAGTGSIFLLRWFWWRVNAYSEITGMVVSFLLAIYFQWFHYDLTGIQLESYEKLLWSIFLTTSSWIIVTFLTKPSDKNTLKEFYSRIKPYGIGWNGFLSISNIPKSDHNNEESPMRDLLLMFLGIFTVYFGLFGTGLLIYGNFLSGNLLLIISFVSAYFTNYIMSYKDKS